MEKKPRTFPGFTRQKRGERCVRARGFALILTLWLVTILGMVGIAFHNTTSLEVKMTRNLLEQTRAHALADSGIQRAIAALRADALDSDHDSLDEAWAGSDAAFREVKVGEGGVFSVFCDNLSDEGTAYGMVDEESKINLNVADERTLLALPGMSRARVDCLIDWRDTDDERGTRGAENAEYQEMPNPYPPRNGPLETIEELLLIRGFNRRLVYGEDMNHNGVLDPGEDDGDGNPPPDNADGRLDRGLSRFVTLWSYERNVDPDGNQRLNINKAKKEQFVERLGALLPETEIDGILKWREEQGKDRDNVFETIGDLLGAGGRNGPELVKKESFIRISEYITTSDEESFPGKVNINTAPEQVLKCIFRGRDESMVQAILSHRESEEAFTRIGEILNVSDFELPLFKKYVNSLTVHSSVFTVRSAGFRERSRAYAEAEAVIDRGATPYRIRYWRYRR